MARTYRRILLRRVGNVLMTGALKAGFGPMNTRLLSVRGRKSGREYTTPVNLVHRDLGLVVPRGNPHGLASVTDLARPGLRLVNRQPGSGTRRFLDLALARAGIAAEGLTGYGDAVSTHWAVALRVLRDEADVGLAARSVAHALELGFVPLVKERFDMVIPKDAFFRPAVQALVEAVRSEGFREGLARLGGYDARQSGRVLAEVS